MPRRVRLRAATTRSVDCALDAYGLHGLLSPTERAALAEIRLERRRRDWLAGRLAAKRVLRAALDEHGAARPPLSAISILNAPGGAPYAVVDGRPGIAVRWSISIAHDDGTAVCAAARTDLAGVVGVDLERERPLAARLLRPVLAASERRWLVQAGGAVTPPPIALWALKEAVVKAARADGVASMRDAELTGVGMNRARARLTSGGCGVRVTARWRRWRGFVLAWALRPAPHPLCPGVG